MAPMTMTVHDQEQAILKFLDEGRMADGEGRTGRPVIIFHMAQTYGLAKPTTHNRLKTLVERGTLVIEVSGQLHLYRRRRPDDATPEPQAPTANDVVAKLKQIVAIGEGLLAK